MKRTLIEVFLAIALIGASVFGWTNWKQNGAAGPQITELKAAAEEAAKTATACSLRLAPMSWVCT